MVINCCGTCNKTDGLVYSTFPPKLKCTITGEFHYYGDDCDCCVNTVQKNRISKDEYYLKIAGVVSERSTCLKRHYGTVIVNNDEIISTGYNGSPRGEYNCCDVHDDCPRVGSCHNSGDYSDCPAVHSEQNALLSASRDKLIGATLYLMGYEVYPETQELTPMKEVFPCPICERMIKNSGITRVVGVQGDIDLWKS